MDLKPPVATTPADDTGALDPPTVTSRLLRWIRWPSGVSLQGNGFENARHLGKWLALSTMIGLVAGAGAIAFYVAIQFSTDQFLGRIVGYLPPSPVGEGGIGLVPMARPWLLPLVTGLGGLISGLIVFNFAPEAEGHGTDAAIEAIHHKRGQIRARIPPIKLIASAITIGSGGSGGREGPAAQISAGFGSLLGQWLNLTTQDRRIAVAAGMGAGIGAIFRAPLGGAVMAAEILYIHDLEVEALIPALIASIVGYTVYGAFFGYSPIFGAQPSLALGSPIQLLYYAVLGVLCGGVGMLYSRSFYGVTAIFHRLRLPRWLKPAIGGVLVGAMGLVVPGALHMGYGWVQIGMSQQILGIPLWMVLLLPFAKILATSLSIGSGGSGGVFGPGMVIGGMLGASFWRVGSLFLPDMPPDSGPMVIVGMMALFGGIAHAPLAVMLMVAEMTGNLSLLAPAMIAIAVSTALVGDETIYRAQVTDRSASPLHRLRFSFPLLGSLLVRDATVACRAVETADTSVDDALALLESRDAEGLVLTDDHGGFVGGLARRRLDEVEPSLRATTRVQDLLDDATPALSPDQTLDVALETLLTSDSLWAPVVENGQLLGCMLARDALTTYQDSARRNVRRIAPIVPGVGTIEARLSADSRLVGHPLRDAGLPKGALVISVTRDGEMIFPRATTVLLAGDVLLLLTAPEDAPALRQVLGA